MCPPSYVCECPLINVALSCALYNRYMTSVMATRLIGKNDVYLTASAEERENIDLWFGSVGRSLYTLFQVLTLESWSMGIARPVLKYQPFMYASTCSSSSSTHCSLLLACSNCCLFVLLVAEPTAGGYSLCCTWRSLPCFC